MPHGTSVEEVYFVPCGVKVCLQLLQGAMRGLVKDSPNPRPGRGTSGRHQAGVLRELREGPGGPIGWASVFPPQFPSWKPTAMTPEQAAEQAGSAQDPASPPCRFTEQLLCALQFSSLHSILFRFIVKFSLETGGFGRLGKSGLPSGIPGALVSPKLSFSGSFFLEQRRAQGRSDPPARLPPPNTNLVALGTTRQHSQHSWEAVWPPLLHLWVNPLHTCG